MITLEEAIKLAQRVHEGQWLKPEPLDHSVYFYKLKDYPEYAKQAFFINEEGFKISIDDTGWVMQKPYITHPLAVMGLMSTEEEKIVAVLHDIIEDTEAFKAVCDEQGHILVYNKKSYSITLKVYEALGLLTYNKSLSYDKYIKYISYNKLATKVKIADIIHNLSCSPSDHAKQKYLKAMPVLLKSI